MLIYKATNTINNECYIGQTIQNIETRQRQHLSFDKAVTLFQKAIRKYGWDNFVWEVVCHCKSKEEMDEMEIHYIKQYANNYNTVHSNTKIVISGNGYSGKYSFDEWMVGREYGDIEYTGDFDYWVDHFDFKMWVLLGQRLHENDNMAFINEDDFIITIDNISFDMRTLLNYLNYFTSDNSDDNVCLFDDSIIEMNQQYDKFISDKEIYTTFNEALCYKLDEYNCFYNGKSVFVKSLNGSYHKITKNDMNGAVINKGDKE